MSADRDPPVQVTRSSFPSKDGLQLIAEHRLVSRRRARLIMLHGYAEHLQRYEALADRLGAAGYECHQFDLRGHGRSEGRRGHVDRFADYRDDLDRFIDKARAVSRSNDSSSSSTPVEIPWLLLGHSVGGLIALNYVLHRPYVFAALALSSPFLAPAFKLPPFSKEISALAAYVLPTLPVKSVMKAKWLSHDPAVIDAYARDPLILSTVTPSWWQAVVGAQQEIFERADEIKAPTLFLLGDADRVADCQRSRLIFNRLGSSVKRLEIYPGFFHEVLNENGSEKVVADLLAWFDEQVARRA